MKIALPHKHNWDSHTDKVKQEMLTLGTPTIKAVWMECYNMFVALEGCNRLKAAKELGIDPIIEEVKYSDLSTDIVVPGSFQDDFLVSDICDRAHKNEVIEF